MLRFRNPGTQFSTQVQVLKQLYKNLGIKSPFSLKDMAVVIAKERLMTAYGYSGDVALSLCQTDNESMNSALMNAKMYAEVFRMLGWVTPAGDKSYPLVFPMFDNGEFKGWVCRTTLKTIEKRRKYLYNEGFSRATTLCGTYSKGKLVVICEGYMDMLKLKQFGLKNVVAILGWKITAEQIAKLKQMGITHVISALDNDECGKKGTSYLKNFFTVTQFQYPANVKDSGEMSQSQFNIAFNKTKAKLKGGK